MCSGAISPRRDLGCAINTEDRQAGKSLGEGVEIAVFSAVKKRAAPDAGEHQRTGGRDAVLLLFPSRSQGAALPVGGRLGIYGFGGSAHLAAQVALAEGATVHVMTRSADARRLALALGAASAGGSLDRPPEPLDSAIVFAPAGEVG